MAPLAYDSSLSPSAFDLTGHVAVVTGGNSGLGLGIARALLNAGATVAIWGRDPTRNRKALDELDATRARIHSWECDVSDEEQVDATFAKVVGDLGKVHSCFVNAGMGGRSVPFINLRFDEWTEVLRTNLDGAFLTCRAAARHMVATEGGSIIVTSSLAANSGLARGQAYAASKGALISLVRGLAVELAHFGIRANAILPGFFETSMTAAWLESEAAQRKIKPRIPLRRWGLIDDLGPLAVFLAGPSSAYLTGQAIIIDGGYSIF